MVWLLWFWPPTKGNQHSLTSNLYQLDKNDDHPRGGAREGPKKKALQVLQACHISKRKCLIFFFFGFTFGRGEQHQAREREGRRGGRAVGMEGGAAVEARRR